MSSTDTNDNGAAVREDGMDGHTEVLCDGALTVDISSVPGGKSELVTKYNGAPIHSGKMKPAHFDSETKRNGYINSVSKVLKNKSGIDASIAESELYELFAVLHETAKEEQEKFYTDDVQRIISAAEEHYPIHVYDGDPTVWKVEMTFAGRTRTLEFTSEEMAGSSPKPLRNKIASRFFEKVEIEKEDWEAITDHWFANKSIEFVSDTTPEDAICERLVEHIRDRVKPVADRDAMQNDVHAAWVDESNSLDIEGAGSTDPIMWVQDSFFVDQLEEIGKTPESKSQWIRSLIERDDMYERTRAQRWTASGNPKKFYPFDPRRLGITDDDVRQIEDETSEVDA